MANFDTHIHIRTAMRSPVTNEILAGLTLAAIGIPEVMGYTKIIGTPVITGLYTMVFPMLLFAWLGSSRHLVVGADSATAAIVASALAGMSFSHQQYSYVEMTSLVALIAGLMLLMARFLRLGFLANFLSRTVLVGFLSGVGIQVALGSIPGMLGLARGGHGFLALSIELIHDWGSIHLLSLTFSVTVLAVVYFMHRFAKRFPAALIVLVMMIVVSAQFDLKARGVKIIGAVPNGLPTLNLPHLDLESLLALMSVSFSCFIVILAQSSATSRAYANRYQDHLSENSDLFGLGVANIAAALSGTFVVNGSPTKTAIVDSSGGRTQWAQVVAAITVMLVLVFFTAPLALLPEAVLSAIVFHIGLMLVDVSSLQDIAHKNRNEFGLAVLTMLTVIALGVMQGIVLALVLSLLFHVNRSYKPHTAVMTLNAKQQWVRNPSGEGLQVVPGILVYWFGADLFYANAGHFKSELEHLIEVAGQSLNWLVIDAGAITGVDYSASRALVEFEKFLMARNIRLIWVHVNDDFVNELRRLDIYKADSSFATLREMLAAYKHWHPVLEQI